MAKTILAGVFTAYNAILFIVKTIKVTEVTFIFYLVYKFKSIELIKRISYAFGQPICF
jgi:hypothetical protein